MQQYQPVHSENLDQVKWNDPKLSKKWDKSWDMYKFNIDALCCSMKVNIQQSEYKFNEMKDQTQ